MVALVSDTARKPKATEPVEAASDDWFAQTRKRGEGREIELGGIGRGDEQDEGKLPEAHDAVGEADLDGRDESFIFWGGHFWSRAGVKISPQLYGILLAHTHVAGAPRNFQAQATSFHAYRMISCASLPSLSRFSDKQ